MRKIAWLVAAVTLFATGTYVFVYLYRWEWHRALFVAIVFVAMEVAVAAALVLRRLSGTSSPAPSPADEQTYRRLREAPRRDHFEWLRRDATGMNVFLTVLLGGGVVVSGLAWVIDRVAHRTAGKRADRQLAEELGELAFPEGGLLAGPGEVFATDAPYDDDPDLRLLVGSWEPGR